MAVLRAGDLDSGRGKGCENEGCELWGERGLIYIYRGGVDMGKVFQLVILQPLYNNNNT